MVCGDQGGLAEGDLSAQLQDAGGEGVLRGEGGRVEVDHFLVLALVVGIVDVDEFWGEGGAEMAQVSRLERGGNWRRGGVRRGDENVPPSAENGSMVSRVLRSGIEIQCGKGKQLGGRDILECLTFDGREVVTLSFPGRQAVSRSPRSIQEESQFPRHRHCSCYSCYSCHSHNFYYSRGTRIILIPS